MTAISISRFAMVWCAVMGGAVVVLLGAALAGRALDAIRLRREERRTVAAAEQLLQDAAR